MDGVLFVKSEEKMYHISSTGELQTKRNERFIVQSLRIISKETNFILTKGIDPIQNIQNIKKCKLKKVAYLKNRCETTKEKAKTMINYRRFKMLMRKRF